MPNGRNNPRRGQFATNPYLQSVFEGIDLLVADTQRHNIIAQQQEVSNVEFERQKNVENLKNKLGLLGGITESKGVYTPETQKKAAETMFEVIKDPDADISEFDIKAFQKTPERTRKLSKYATHETWGFPKFKDEELPDDVADFMEEESRKRRKTYYDTLKGPGDEPERSRTKFLDEHYKEVQKMLTAGYKEGGWLGTVGMEPEVVRRYAEMVHDLRRADSENRWTEKEEAIYKVLKPLIAQGLEGQELLEQFKGSGASYGDRSKTFKGD